jgi:hypothetical protein
MGMIVDDGCIGITMCRYISQYDPARRRQYNHTTTLVLNPSAVFIMRFTSITFGLVAFLTASAVAAPTPNTNDVAKRMPTPEQFEALAPEEKREAYKAIYRATNIIGKSDGD